MKRFYNRIFAVESRSWSSKIVYVRDEPRTSGTTAFFESFYALITLAVTWNTCSKKRLCRLTAIAFIFHNFYFSVCITTIDSRYCSNCRNPLFFIFYLFMQYVSDLYTVKVYSSGLFWKWCCSLERDKRNI